MKLYVWQPKQHGLNSFFIMSESKEIALNEIKKHKIYNVDNLNLAIEELLERYYNFYEVCENTIVFNEND